MTPLRRSFREKPPNDSESRESESASGKEGVVVFLEPVFLPLDRERRTRGAAERATLVAIANMKGESPVTHHGRPTSRSNTDARAGDPRCTGGNEGEKLAAGETWEKRFLCSIEGPTLMREDRRERSGTQLVRCERYAEGIPVYKGAEKPRSKPNGETWQH